MVGNRILAGVVLAILGAAGIGIWAAGTSRNPEPRSIVDNAIVDNASVTAGGTTGFDDSIPRPELPAMIRRAESGDNSAAASLGYHFAASGQRAEQIRWHTLAANRGHCESISALQYIAYQQRDRSAYNRWNDSLRQHGCTFGSMHPTLNGPIDVSTPMWDNEAAPIWNGS